MRGRCVILPGMPEDMDESQVKDLQEAAGSLFKRGDYKHSTKCEACKKRCRISSPSLQLMMQENKTAILCFRCNAIAQQVASLVGVDSNVRTAESMLGDDSAFASQSA